MIATHGDHEYAFSVLRNSRVGAGVQDGGVRLAKPVACLLYLCLNSLKRAALVMRFQVLHIFQQQNLRLPRPELPDNPDDVKKQKTTFVLEAQLVACYGEGLAREARRQH